MTGQQTTQVVSGGIGLPTALFLIFLVLKLIGAITWSWWWVTSPLWIPFALVVALWIIGVCIFALGFLLFHYGSKFWSR